MLVDETDLHDADRVQLFSEYIRRGFPEARITSAFSWQALHDPSARYQEIRAAVSEQHRQYGEVITFVPGGYFANVNNTSAQVNQDISEALLEISRLYSGIAPGP